MADRIVKVSLKGDVSDYTASLAKAATATRALGDTAEQNNRKIGASSDDAAHRVSGIREQLVELSRTKVNVATAVDTVAARVELDRLRAELAGIDQTDATAEAHAETAAAEVQLRALQSTLNRIDGQTVTARVNIDDAGSTALMSGRISGLASTVAALSPAFGAVGASAVAGLGAIAPLTVTAGAGLGVLALGFSGVSDTADLLEQRATATGASLETINQKLAAVNPATLSFATYLNDDLRPALEEVQGRAAAGLLPGVQEALQNIQPHLGAVGDFVGRLGGRLGELAVEASETFTSPVWQDFWDMIDENADPVVSDFVHTLLNMATGFTGITTAFMPMARDVAGGIVDLSEKFATWGTELAESQGFRTFEAYVRENWPKVQEIVANLATTIGTMIEAGAPIGSAFLDAFVVLTDVLSALPVPVVQSLLTVFIAYKTLTGVSDLINGIGTSLSSVSMAVNRMTPAQFTGISGGITGVGTAAAGASGPTGGFAGHMTKLSGVAAGAGAIATGLMVIGGGVTALGEAVAPELPRTEEYMGLLLGMGGGMRDVDTAAAALGSNTVTGINNFGDVLNRVVNPSATDRLNDFGSELFNVVTFGVGPGENGAATLDRSNQFLVGLDTQLAQLVNSGNAPAAAESFAAIQREAEKQGITTQQLIALFPEYQGALQGVDNANQITKDGQAGVNEELAKTPSLYELMTGSAQEQVGIYQETLQAKIDKDREAAQATADSTASSTDSWRDHVGNVGLSLDEYGAALDEDVAKHDEWRENIKIVTERGGAEVGAALLAMGEDGAALTAQMAQATDEDFFDLAESMKNHARNGGAAAVREIDLAMKAMDYVSREGTKATVEGMAHFLGIGVEEARVISENYGLNVAGAINPLLEALGKAKVGTSARGATAQMAFRSLDRADGGVTDYYANGGVRESHVATIAPAGAWRVWAEPETGGESYIPLAPSKRRRSLDIWRETGKRLGVGDVMQFAQGSIVDLGRELQRRGARVTGHGAFGGTEPGQHGRTSLHYSNQALDVNTRAGTSALEQRELGPMAALARARGFRTIFMAPGHYNHLHIDTGGGASMGSVESAPAVDVPKPPGMGKFRMPISTLGDAAMEKVYNEAVAWVAENAMSEGPSGGGSVERWRGVVNQALGIVGQPLANANRTLRRMQQESGGNPNIVNKWDSNWRKGTPSVGLMQVIGPTYRRHRHPAHDVGPYVYGTSTNPLSNVLSSMRYALSSYGSLASAYDRRGGYDSGGVAQGIGMLPKYTPAPERVLSPRQTEAFEQMVSREFGASAFSGGGGIDYGRLAAALGQRALVGEIVQNFHGDNSEHKAVEELQHALTVADLGGRYALGAAA